MKLRLLVLGALILGFPYSAASNRGPAGDDGRQQLLQASSPGAYSIRYRPDRAQVSTSAEEETDLSFYLAHEPQWAYVDGKKRRVSTIDWNAKEQMVSLTLSAGDHRMEIGWAGTGERPVQGQRIPVMCGGEPVGQLAARFTPDEMTAEGTVDIPYGEHRASLEPAKDIADLTAGLMMGDSEIGKWWTVRGRIQGRRHVYAGGDCRIRLKVASYNLLSSPIRALHIEPLVRAARALRVEQMPQEGTIIEAEDFVRNGGEPVLISEGDHVNQHGGKSIYSFHGNGAWLEWDFVIDETGLYDLYARIACDPERSFRLIGVDRRERGGFLKLVQFPSTGGWAHAPGEWWAMHVAGASDDLPALQLSEGKHTLRAEGVLEYHLNIDYFVLKKR